MNTQLMVSTALVTTQASRQTQSSASVPDPSAAGLVEAPSAAANTSAIEAVPPATGGDTAGKAASPQSAPNSALTTYRDQDSGRIIVRVYDRESGDVLVEFPPEKAFRPAGTPASGAAAKPKTSFSV